MLKTCEICAEEFDTEIDESVNEYHNHKEPTNMKTQPTPGPWKAVFQHQPLATDHWAVETSDGKNTPAGIVLNEANARLIAAAPEMLEALKSVELIFNGQHNLLSTATIEEKNAVIENAIDFWNKKCRLIITKATGGK